MLFQGDKISVNEAVKQLSLKGYEISASQIRKLDNMGLINLRVHGAERREITASAIDKLEIILNLRSIGVPLKNIKKLLEMYDRFEEERIDEIEGASPDYLAKYRDRYIEEERQIYKSAIMEINQRFDHHISNVTKSRDMLNRFSFFKK